MFHYSYYNCIHHTDHPNQIPHPRSDKLSLIPQKSTIKPTSIIHPERPIKPSSDSLSPLPCPLLFFLLFLLHKPAQISKTPVKFSKSQPSHHARHAHNEKSESRKRCNSAGNGTTTSSAARRRAFINGGLFQAGARGGGV